MMRHEERDKCGLYSFAIALIYLKSWTRNDKLNLSFFNIERNFNIPNYLRIFLLKLILQAIATI